MPSRVHVQELLSPNPSAFNITWRLARLPHRVCGSELLSAHSLAVLGLGNTAVHFFCGAAKRETWASAGRRAR